MEDLAHFIQSMSEKYGLLDSSHKQGGNNSNYYLHDRTSSAASNTSNKEDCQGSSWECLSIFISGSQSINCKTVPSDPHVLPLLPTTKMLANPLQQTDNNGTDSPPPNCLSKLMDIDESTPFYNPGTGTLQQRQESPDDDFAHLGASSTVMSSDMAESGTMFDNCGDVSTAVSISNCIHQCYNPREEYNINNFDTTCLNENSCNNPELSLIPKNSGHAQHHQQSTQNAAAINSVASSTPEVQELHVTKRNEGSGAVAPRDSTELMLQPSRLSRGNKNSSLRNSPNGTEVASGLAQIQQQTRDISELLSQDKKILFQHKSALGVAAESGSVCGLGQEQEQQQQQRPWNTRQRDESSSASVGRPTQAEYGDFDVALHEYEISSGRTTSRDSRTSIYTPGCCHEAYQTDLREETTSKDIVKHTSFGGKSSRTQCNHEVKSDSAALSGSQGEHQEKGLRGVSGCNGSSTEILAPAENGYCHQQQGNHDGTARSSSPIPYLPISSAMESRVAQLDEASKEFFASSRNNAVQNLSQLNVISGLLDDGESRHNSSASSDSHPALKKAGSFRDFSHATLSAAGKEDIDPKLYMEQGSTTLSTEDHESNHIYNRPRVSLAKFGALPHNPYKISEGEKFVESWEQIEDLQKAAGMEGGGVHEPKWSHINKLLSENGFSPLDWQLITSATEVADKFFHTLNEVVRNYGRREKAVKELLAEREALRQEEKHSNEIIQKVEHENDLLKRKLASSEQRAELANAAAEKTYAVLRKENQRLEASCASMLQRCSQLEHGSRAKERALRKLQEKIQESVQREERQRQKEKDLYEKLKHKIAVGQKSQGGVVESNFLLRDLKPATIVGIYERQRAAVEVEISNLREENSRMCRELREKENALLSKTMSTAEVAQPGFDERENALFQQLTEIDNVLKTKTFCGQKLAPRGDTTLLSLEVNQREDLKKDSDDLQMQLRSQPAEKQSSAESVLDRMKMDGAPGRRSYHPLQETSREPLNWNCSSALLAGELNGCTSMKCQEYLQGICSRLKVADPARITGAIDGLLKLVAAVPRMETFIEQVCDIFFNDGAVILERVRKDDMQETPDAVPVILKSWLEQLRSVEELQQFKETISAQLWERFDEKAVKHPMSARVAAASVKDLIDIERQYLLSQASYREAQITLKAEPQKLLHRIISHFQMLFEISQLEGVMAVMNSVYIQISEYHNFARALCSMLGLPKDARPNSIISTITSIINKG